MEYRTDKYKHGHIPMYMRLLEKFGDKPFTLLEIGTLEGGSLQFFGNTFPNARIVGVDIRKPSLPLPSNVTFHLISQDNPEEIKKLGDFDVIIDDASHEEVRTLKCLNALWGQAKHAYVIEDWAVGYMKDKPYGKMDYLIADIINNNKYGASGAEIKWDENASYAVLFK